MNPPQAAAPSVPSSTVLAFGPFRLEPARGVLLRQGAVCPLGGRALDILIALVEQAGETVSKQDLLRCAWPNTMVTEANIRIQIAALRRVLGDGQDGQRFIVNVAGQGYRFVAQVTRLAVEPPANLPASSGRVAPSWLIPDLIAGPAQGQVRGRDAAIESVARSLDTHRCVTLTGPGGIGKTTLALAVLHRQPALRAAARFVDIAGIGDPAALPGILQAALDAGGVHAAPGSEIQLLVLDGCEHLANAVAAWIEPLLYRNTLIRVLATSREALRISGECVIPTPPLATLPEGGVITLAQARASAAEGLFLDRAAACLGEMHPTDADAAIISELCRRLDGLALAIELVAGQIDQFGLGGLLRLIGDPLQLANQARRGGLARHASLAACVEWSLRTLSVAEYAVLRRLAALPERFRLTEAIDAAGHEAPAALLSLEARSLVLADSTTGEPTFRLPAITRAVVLAAGADWPARPETSQPGTAQTP